MTKYWPTYAICGVLLGTVLLVGFVFTLPEAQRDTFLSEEGPIETASALLYFVAAAVVIWLAGALWKRYLPEIVTLLGLGGRELDLDDRLTTNGLMKPNQYVGPDVALTEKMISASVLVALLWAGFIVLWRYLPHLLKWHRAGHRAATAGLLMIAYIIIAELFDSPSKKVEVFGMDWGARENQVALWVEETIELGIPFLLLIAIVAGLTISAREGSATQ